MLEKYCLKDICFHHVLLKFKEMSNLESNLYFGSSVTTKKREEHNIMFRSVSLLNSTMWILNWFTKLIWVWTFSQKFHWVKNNSKARAKIKINFTLYNWFNDVVCKIFIAYCISLDLFITSMNSLLSVSGFCRMLNTFMVKFRWTDSQWMCIIYTV